MPANDYSESDDVFANFEADPMFVDAAAGDFHLTPSSLGVDAGDPAAPEDPDGTRADIGPFATTQVMSVPPGRAPLRLSLSPNPARERAEIRLSYADRKPLSTSITDASGRLVRRFARDPMATGELVLSWDTRDDSGRLVPAGLYFVHVLTQQRRQTGRLVIVR
jgi:hypothetical protein